MTSRHSSESVPERWARRGSSIILFAGAAALGAAVIGVAFGGGDLWEWGKDATHLFDDEGRRMEATPTVAAVGVGTEAAFLDAVMADARAAGGARTEAATTQALDALKTGDTSALVESIQLSSAPCVITSHGSGFPPCQEGQKAGDVVVFVPAADPTLQWGFPYPTLPKIINALFEGNSSALLVAGRTETERGTWILEYVLAEDRAAPEEAYYALTARWVTVELDPRSETPIVAFSWGETDPLSMYRLWDPGLSNVLFVDPRAVAEEQAIVDRTSQGEAGPIPTVSAQ